MISPDLDDWPINLAAEGVGVLGGAAFAVFFLFGVDGIVNPSLSTAPILPSSTVFLFFELAGASSWLSELINRPLNLVDRLDAIINNSELNS